MARSAYSIALELDRTDPSLLKAVERSEAERKDWEGVARAIEKEANAASAVPAHRAALIVKRARLLERRQENSDVAIELYETALRLDPSVIRSGLCPEAPASYPAPMA